MIIRYWILTNHIYYIKTSPNTVAKPSLNIDADHAKPLTQACPGIGHRVMDASFNTETKTASYTNLRAL